MELRRRLYDWTRMASLADLTVVEVGGIASGWSATLPLLFLRKLNSAPNTEFENERTVEGDGIGQAGEQRHTLLTSRDLHRRSAR
jgi:hypothetical protein